MTQPKREAKGRRDRRCKSDRNVDGRRVRGAIAEEAFERELQAAASDDLLIGYMARVLIGCTLPHRRLDASAFERRNGRYVVSILSPPSIGLPYGRYPRLLLCWVTTEAVRRGTRFLSLGRSLNEFMSQLGLDTLSGGPRSVRDRLCDQMRRLFTSAVSLTIEGDRSWSDRGFRLTDKLSLWWNVSSPADRVLWGSTLRLSPAFYEAIVDRPVPVDVRVVRALRSPLAIDLYCWLTYRQSYLRRKVTVPWEHLACQFGQGYGRLCDFRKRLLRRLREVERYYLTGAAASEAGLVLHPRRTHVPKLFRNEGSR